MNKIEFLAMELMLDDACEMRVRKAGVYKFHEGYKFKQHSHLEYEINYVSGGQGIMVIEGEKRRISQGECIVIPPYKKHSFYVEFKTGCKLTQVELTMEMENEIKKAFPFCNTERNYYAIKTCEVLIPMIEKIAKIHRHDQENDYHRTMIKLSIIELMLSIGYHMQQMDSNLKEKTTKKMKAAIAFIQSHYTEELDLEAIAKANGISSRYLRKYFFENMGMSCIQYITSLRIQHAKRLLWDTEDSVLSVAIDSGYGSAQYFSKIFKKIEGMSPRQYRMKWKEKYKPSISR